MDDRTFKILVAIGMLLYGSLYLTGVFVAAVLTRNHAAEWMAVASAGAVYLCFYAGWSNMRSAAAIFNGLGIGGGIVAGLFLLVL